MFGGAVALTAYGAYEMYKVVGVGTTTALEWVLVVLFVLTFSWLAQSFTASVVGFIWLLTHPRKQEPLPALPFEKTAVVMPIYNEAPSRVFGTMQAIIEDVDRTGLGSAFDFFLFRTPRTRISGSPRSAPLWRCASACPTRASFTGGGERTRAARPAISPTSSPTGRGLRHMLVLDADSVMAGDTIVRLAAAMEADPDAGIIQSLPLIINRNTLFARRAAVRRAHLRPGARRAA